MPRPAPKAGVVVLLRRFLAARGGAAAVEAAFALPIATIFIFGIFQVGWAIYLGGDVRHAIERASRLYLSNASTTDTAFRSQVQSNLTAARMSDIGLTVTKPVSGGVTMAQIAWTYRYTIQIPFMSPQTFNFDSQIVTPVRPS
jgi:Flp pilus assembly protein TadG